MNMAEEHESDIHKPDKKIHIDKRRKSKGVPRGVTRKEFHDLIRKASQPIKREEQSDSKKTET